jgi:hypothetical protein
MMFKGDRLPLPVAVVLIILAYAVLAPMLINTGIADNGDFTRSMQWFIEKPADFPANWPSDDASWDRRFTKFWIDEWTLKQHPDFKGMESRSSAQLLNMMGMAANALAGNDDYSLRVASIPIRIIDLAAFAAMAVLFFAATGSAALTCATFLVISTILLDVNYKAFFNSFYEDRASLLYLTILIPATVMAFKVGCGRVWKIVFAVSLALFATSKAQLAPTPAILLIVCLLHAHGSRSRRGLVSMAGLFLVPQMIALMATSGYEFRNVNAYNAIFLGAATFSDDPSRHFGDFPPDAVRCVGVNAYVAGTCFKELSPLATHGKVVRIYLTDLAALGRAIDFAAEAMHDIALDAYGKGHLDGAVTPLIEPALWTSIKRLMPMGIGFYVLAMAVSGLLLCLSRVTELRPFVLAAQFLCAIAVSQTVVTVVGDGRAEIQKHLLVGNFAFDLALVLTIALAAQAIRTIRVSRLP